MQSMGGASTTLGLVYAATGGSRRAKRLFVCLFVCLLVCLFACLLVCLSACLLVCLIV